MKKLFLVSALVLIMVSPVFAASGDEMTNTFSVGGGQDSNGDATQTLTCGLSNNVHAVYYTDGSTTAPSQWYSIGTYHIGGTEVYATAQDITSIYKLKAGKVPGNTYEWTGMPEDSTASATWSSDVWKQL